jgi:hypothetical protein
MNKHTPGPWSVSEINAANNVDEFHIFIEPNVAIIERKIEGQNECDMPDALLIAAAPELLEALQLVLHSKDAIALEKARAAIAKALGEQP